MIFRNGNILDTNANFIINLCDDINITNCITDRYPHIKTEYKKYVRYCDKYKVDIVGTTQYVPVDVWAITMIDTMKNNNIFKYDDNYQYIVNLTCATTEQGINHKAIKNGIMGVCKKAKKFGSNKVAILCNEIKEYNFDVVKEAYQCSDLEIEIWN